MATASDLAEAAGQSFANLFALWQPGGDDLRSAVIAFAQDLLPEFPESDVVGRPIASWLVLIASASQTMPDATAPAQIPYGMLARVADYVYRICWLGAKPTPESPDISTEQQAAILASYNDNF